MRRIRQVRSALRWLRDVSRLAVAGSCLLTFNGCTESPDDLPQVATRDSAGVQIVESRRPAWLTGGWTVSPEPSVVVGRIDGAPEYLLDRVTGALRLSDGSIVIANGGTRELRVYDSSGNFLKRIGRPGDGPGEFQELHNIFRYSGDTIAVVDATRLQLFTPSAGYLETLSLPITELAGVLGALQDGSLVVAKRILPASGRPTLETLRKLAFDRVSRSGELISRLAELTEMTGVLITYPREVAAPIVFGPRLQAKVAANKLYAGYPDDFAIDVYEAEGTLGRRLRKPWTRILVDQSHMDAYLESFYRLGAPAGTPVPQAGRELRERMAREFAYSDVLPAFADLVADDLGYLWVSGFDIEHALEAPHIRTIASRTRWSVFDPAGVWQGQVEMPGHFTPLQIGADFVLGLTRDDLGIERLELLSLDRSNQ